MCFYVFRRSIVSYTSFYTLPLLHLFIYLAFNTSVPQNKDDFGKCNLGEGCPADCSGKGVCLPVRIDRPIGPLTSTPTSRPTVPLQSSPSSSPVAAPDARSNPPTALPTNVTTAPPFTPSGSPTKLPVQSTQGPSSFMTGYPTSNKPIVVTIVPSYDSYPPLVTDDNPTVNPTFAPTSQSTFSLAPSLTPTGTGSPSRITALSDSTAAAESMSVSPLETLLSGDTLDTSLYVPSSSLYCHCDTGWYGSTCVLSSPPMCLASSFNILLDLFDSFGDGWTFANYAITNADTGMVVDGAFDSLCAGKADERSYCVTPGPYTRIRYTYNQPPFTFFFSCFDHNSSLLYLPFLFSVTLPWIIASPHSQTFKRFPTPFLFFVCICHLYDFHTSLMFLILLLLLLHLSLLPVPFPPTSSTTSYSSFLLSCYFFFLIFFFLLNIIS